MPTIFIYLYRDCDGEPQYVGQTIDLLKRDKRHSCQNDCFFDQVLQLLGRETFTLEVVDQVESVSQGPLANALENTMMDRYGTYRPDTGKGWNLARAGGPLEFSAEEQDRYLKVLRAVMNSDLVRGKLRRAWASNRDVRVAALRQMCQSTEWRRAVREALADPEVKERHRKGTKESSNRPEVRAKKGTFRGRKHRDESKKKIGHAQKGRQRSDEERRHASEGHQGQVAWNNGKKLSDEHRASLVQSHQGQEPWNKGKKTGKGGPRGPISDLKRKHLCQGWVKRFLRTVAWG